MISGARKHSFKLRDSPCQTAGWVDFHVPESQSNGEVSEEAEADVMEEAVVEDILVTFINTIESLLVNV